ncbi:MAG: XdhC family protein [Planctomycetota bacterium]
MRELLPELLEAITRQTNVAYCRLVETRGSTPQKAGATMLVFPDGSQAGTLGGGCVEAEVKRRALAVMQDGMPMVATFQLDSDYGWDDGLICGGRMRIVIQPIAGVEARHYFQQLAACLEAGQGITEAVVFESEASGLPVPAFYLFDHQDRCQATLVRTESSGSPANALPDTAEPPLVRQHLVPLITRPRPYAQRGIAYLPVLPRCRLLIVGGGHVGRAVAELAIDLDFDVCVMDDREEYVSAERFPRVQQRLSGPIDEVLPAVSITPDTFCLIVTRGHSHDERALYHLADRGARYVGMIGSRRKIKLIFADLLEAGVSVEVLRRVHAPVGLDIGSQTVPEIAVSICAELIAFRNTGQSGPQSLAREELLTESG